MFSSAPTCGTSSFAVREPAAVLPALVVLLVVAVHRDVVEVAAPVAVVPFEKWAALDG